MNPTDNPNPDYSDFQPTDKQVKPKKKAKGTYPKFSFEGYYWHSANSRIWFIDADGIWARMNSDEFTRYLNSTFGLSKSRKGGASECDQVIVWIQMNRHITAIMPLAGYEGPKVYDFQNQKIFVPYGPKLITPAEGEYPVTLQFLAGLLPGIQDEHFKWWLSTRLEQLYGWVKLRGGKPHPAERVWFRPSQAVVLCGKAKSGKSLLQRLITLWVGGRMAKPFRFMSGGTQFNSELFAAEHLMIEDEESATDIKTRRKFASAIKEFTANREHYCHPKFQVPVMTPALSQVLTISVNDEPENLAILPPQDESIKDKAIIYRVDKLPMPMPTDTWEEEQAFWKVLEAEAPAFIFDLLNKTTVPPEWQDSRYGVLAYHHAEILDVLAQLGEEQSLLEIIDIELFEEPSRDEPLKLI